MNFKDEYKSEMNKISPDEQTARRVEQSVMNELSRKNVLRKRAVRVYIGAASGLAACALAAFIILRNAPLRFVNSADLKPENMSAADGNYTAEPPYANLSEDLTAADGIFSCNSVSDTHIEKNDDNPCEAPENTNDSCGGASTAPSVSAESVMPAPDTPADSAASYIPGSKTDGAASYVPTEPSALPEALAPDSGSVSADAPKEPDRAQLPEINSGLSDTEFFISVSGNYAVLSFGDTTRRFEFSGSTLKYADGEYLSASDSEGNARLFRIYGDFDYLELADPDHYSSALYTRAP